MGSELVFLILIAVVLVFGVGVLLVNVEAGQSFSEVESTKSVSDIYAPVAGTIVEVNTDLGDARSASTRTPTARAGSA